MLHEMLHRTSIRNLCAISDTQGPPTCARPALPMDRIRGWRAAMLVPDVDVGRVVERFPGLQLRVRTPRGGEYPSEHPPGCVGEVDAFPGVSATPR